MKKKISEDFPFLTFHFSTKQKRFLPMRYTDLQSYFNDAVAYLSTMTQRSYDSTTGRCAYHEPSTNNRCIVGHFIPDGHDALRACGTIKSVVHHNPDLIGVAVPSCRNGVEFAYKLQLIHDAWFNWGASGFSGLGWDAVKCLANNYNLTFTQPDLDVDKLKEDIGEFERV